MDDAPDNNVSELRPRRIFPFSNQNHVINLRQRLSFSVELGIQNTASL